MNGVTLETSLTSLLSAPEASALRQAFGFETVADLVMHYPRRYDRRGALTPIRGLPVGEHVTVIAEIVQVQERRMQRRNGSILEATLTDGQGELKLTWFNQRWRKEQLTPGLRGLFSGKVTEYRGSMQLAHPEYQLFAEDETISEDPAERERRAQQWRSDFVPIYPATNKTPSWVIHRAMTTALAALEHLDDPLPKFIREAAYELFASEFDDDVDTQSVMLPMGNAEWGDDTPLSGFDTHGEILDFGSAMRLLHQPMNVVQQRQANRSLLFREAFELQLGILDRKRRSGAQNTRSWPETHGGLLTQFDEQLLFTLTEDQEWVSRTIALELAREQPMHRLLQGEVASGKTLVALRAMLQIADGGGQAALLAPTEVLASQHLRSITELLGPELTRALSPTLLTGQLSASERRRALLNIASGAAHIVVGTHALMSATTTFHDLGLIVIDEQHRFGVEQRDALRRKGKLPPHQLVMTATPIPRTIALTAFGDLDVSVIRTLPPGRQGIESFVVPTAAQPQWELRAWQRAAEEIARGRQVYVVCPAISPTEQEEGQEAQFSDTEPALPGLANVEETMFELQLAPPLRNARIAALTGAMRSEDKDRVMREFAAGKIDILVATTVIEVGVNVPNASTMIIRDAHRFGVSQLHQLRGRVGRGRHPGLCLLITPASPGSGSLKRVQKVASTTDGFELAEYDLQVRREGDLLGARQSGGETGLRLLRVSKHGRIIEQARVLAEQLLADDPELASVPMLKLMVRKGRESDIENLGKS